MNVKRRTESEELTVGGTENVFLTVTIGNAQIGGNVARFKNSSVILAKGEITNLDLGPGADLCGKTLKVTTNVLDVNEQTNSIVITYFFHACTPPVTFFHDTVTNDGDIFSLSVEFSFK